MSLPEDHKMTIAWVNLDDELRHPWKEDAGQRNSQNIDTTTFFSIPGSGLPNRHCNIEVHITAAVTSDMYIYISINNGKIWQYVKGQNYDCRIFGCPHPFELYIPYGSTGWDEVQFSYNGQDCKNEVVTLSGKDLGGSGQGTGAGEVHKTYENTTPFEWHFNECKELKVGDKYSDTELRSWDDYRVDGNGGFSLSNSKFVCAGNLLDEPWQEQMEKGSMDGAIWVAGGIMYISPNPTTAPITSSSIEVPLLGLFMAAYYYPGDIRKGDVRMSLNRAGGYFRIYKPSLDPESLPVYLTSEDGWRDVKNTENDAAVAEGGFENYGFRLQPKKATEEEDTTESSSTDEENNGLEWYRLLLTGVGGDPDGDYSESPDDGSSDDGSGSGSTPSNPGSSSSTSDSGSGGLRNPGGSTSSNSGSGGCCCM